MGSKVLFDQDVPEGSECWYESRNLTARCLLIKSTHSDGIFRVNLQILEIILVSDLTKHYKAGHIFEVSKHDEAPHMAGWSIRAELIE